MIPFYISFLAAIGTVALVIIMGYTITWFIAHVMFDPWT